MKKVLATLVLSICFVFVITAGSEARAHAPNTVIDSVLSTSGQVPPIVDDDGDGNETAVTRFHGEIVPVNRTLFRCRIDNGAQFSCTSPHSFQYPVGTHTIEVQAYNKRSGEVDLTPATRTFDVLPGPPPPPPPTDPVITAAGDISDSGSGDTATATLINNLNPTKVLTLGDNVYADGTLSEFNTFYNPTWGQFKAKTSPSPGNHDYHTSGAAGYFDYFNGVGVNTGPAGTRGQGYYAYNVGAWRLYSLNSNIARDANSAQVAWLKQDLAANPKQCSIAYWHHSRWMSGDGGSGHFSDASMGPIYQVLYDEGADVVLGGHTHLYERFARQNPAGQVDNEFGIRQFVAGTGGAPRDSIVQIAANSQVRSNAAWGVVKLTLHDGSYDWKFEPVAGSTFTDSGSEACHGKPVTPPPPPPGSFKFQDEFDGPAGSAPDSTKWSVFGGSAPPRWGNECFVNDRQHVFQDGQGNLVLRANSASTTPCTTDGSGAGILSGGMETGSRSSPKFTFKYGDSEARIAVDCLTGLWATYWHSGGTAGVSWPTDGEIDVMELLNNGTGANQALHMPGGHVQTRPTGQWCGTGYHTYRARWEPGQISFYIDGTLIKTWTPANICAGCTWPFDTAGYVQRIIAELSIGGSAGTPPASFDVTQRIDYIRIANLN